MKKLLSMLLALAMVLAMVPAVSAETYTGSCGVGINWTLDSVTGVLTIRGEGEMKDCSATGGPWSDHNKEITSIVIEPGITAIGVCCFSGCTNVTSVSIPEGVPRIGAGAFRWINKLVTVKLPESLETIEGDAFTGCNGLKYITIPANVKTVGESAFQDCDELVYVKMYEGIESVGNYAFSYCPKLVSVLLPDSITSLGTHVFQNCTSLVAGNISDHLTEVPENTFYNCKSLVSVDMGTNVTTIGKFAFYECESLTGLVLPEGLLTLGSSCFDSSGLEQIVLPSTLTQIAQRAFTACESLKKVAVLSTAGLINRKIIYLSHVMGVVGTTTIYGYESYSDDSNLYTAYEYAGQTGFGFEFITEENLWEDQMVPAPDTSYLEYSVIDNPFTDVKDPSKYYYTPVLWAYSNNITSGMTATTFGPDGTCTRGQVVTFLWRAMDCPEPETSASPFIDVPKN